MAEKFVSSTGLSQVLTKIKETYVEKVDGKGLSANDLTNELLAKLNASQANVLESVKVNGTVQTITDKAVDITVPTKTSQITNDSGFITSSDIPEGAAASTTVPLMDGEAAVGTEMAFARGNHRHPTDTSRAAAADLTAEVSRAKAAEEANSTAAAAAKTAADEAQADVDALTTRVAANETAISTLNGTGAGSVSKTVTDAINEFAAKVSDDGTVNTYKELIDYAAEHGAEFTELVGEVSANTNAIATLNGTGAGSVAKAVSDAVTPVDTRVAAIEEDYIKASELVALTESEIDTIWANA